MGNWNRKKSLKNKVDEDLYNGHIFKIQWTKFKNLIETGRTVFFGIIKQTKNTCDARIILSCQCHNTNKLTTTHTINQYFKPKVQHQNKINSEAMERPTALKPS